MKDIEVELKFPLLNPKGVISNLKRKAKVKKLGDFQKDTYFIPKHRNFLKQKPISEWLRVRETKLGASLNYKHWHNLKDKQAIHCDEYETSVEDIKSLKKILESLDFEEIIVVDKVRDTWNFKKAEVAIDKVKNLGTFIEVEAKGAFKSIDEAKDYLHKILKELGAKVGPQDFKGYPYWMIEKKKISPK